MVTDNLSDFFEEAYTDHSCNLNIINKKVITVVQISEIFWFTVKFLFKRLIMIDILVPNN